MLPELGFLGALQGSRCGSETKARRVAPRSTESTQKGNDSRAKTALRANIGALESSPSTIGEILTSEPVMLPDTEEDQSECSENEATASAARQMEARWRASISAKGHKNSLWRLAGVEVRAFAGRHRTMWWRLIFRAAILLSLVAYAKRVHPSGQALCLLWLRPLRFLGGIAGLLLIVCIAAAIYPLVGAVLGAAIATVLLPCGVATVKARSGWRQLAKLTPPGRHIYVHSVASELPGAGADLLRALALEADEQRWSLVLDASNEKLVLYYEQFGFGALGPGVQMPDGARHVRMWRPPITPERGPLCGRTGYGVISTQ